MHKMVKTCNICAIMDLNQNYVSKLLFLQSTAYIPGICWNLDLNFTLCCAHSGHSGTVSLHIFVPTEFCCAQKRLFWTYTIIKQVFLP